MREEVSLDLIRRAADRIKPLVHRTPLVSCAAIDREAGCRVLLKAENFQKTGSFKARGAANAVALLNAAEAARGVATHSSGNHGQALAYAARARGVPAHVVMPRGSPEIKKAAVRGYGGTIVECGDTLAAREERLAALVSETGAAFIHGYDDPRVIAGQGTIGLELFEDRPELDAIVGPVGGGGLMSGIAVAAAGLSGSVRVFGAEPELADDAYRSLIAGEPLGPRPPITIADGLRAALSRRTFSILKERLERIILIGEEDILAAMRLIWERAKLVVEPSGAAALAAVLKERGTFQGKTVAVMLSGGNLDLIKFPIFPSGGRYGEGEDR